MGFKRPFDDEECRELPCKHPRPLDFSNKTTQFVEVVPLPTVPQKPAALVENEGDLCKSQGGESSDDETFDDESNFLTRGLDMGAAFTWVTKTSGGENINQSSLPQEYFELDRPPQIFPPVEDVYSFLLDRHPRKQVPVGPEHQADIPEWQGSGKDVKQDVSDIVIQNHAGEHSEKEKLAGTCVIPMPDLSSPQQEDLKVGGGRKDCICLDKGSLRCVRQHIKEVREEMFKILGCEKFETLGFYDMGEEVVRNWSEEDEQIFHDVVYSNPVSLGRNFWRHLEAVFPSRTKKEIVSYYFNVFVLRRRATQNRSRMLDIDSDDDEWLGACGGSLGIQCSEEDEDSDIESPFHQENERVYMPHHEDDDDNESDSDNDEDDQGDVDIGNGDNMAEGRGLGLSDDCKINSADQHVDKFSESAVQGLNVEDDSCTSFEVPHDMVEYNGNMDNKPATTYTNKYETGFGGDHQKKLEGCTGPVSQAYLFEQCDAKVWSERFADVTMQNTDLLPTRSIIEELFGQGTWDNNTRNK